jgi:hypothetical protein
MLVAFLCCLKVHFRKFPDERVLKTIEIYQFSSSLTASSSQSDGRLNIYCILCCLKCRHGQQPNVQLSTSEFFRLECLFSEVSTRCHVKKVA